MLYLPWRLEVIGDMKCQGVFRALDKIWEIREVNSGQLSDWREAGIPNPGTLSLRRVSETVWAFLLVGKASIYTEKVSTNTRRYLTCLTLGMWVKSNCQSVPGREPLAWWVRKGNLWNLKLGSDIWQVLQEAVIVFKKSKSSVWKHGYQGQSRWKQRYSET